MRTSLQHSCSVSRALLRDCVATTALRYHWRLHGYWAKELAKHTPNLALGRTPFLSGCALRKLGWTRCTLGRTRSMTSLSSAHA